MGILNGKLEIAFAVLAIASANPVSAATLTTPLAGGNENDGVMFDMTTGANALTLTSIGANVFGTASYQIYYKAGSINTSITDPGVGNGNVTANGAAWTLIGTFNNIVGIGTLSAQSGGIVDFDITDVALNANSTYGLYITQMVTNAGQGSGVRFTNSTLGSTVVSDSNLSILNSRGVAYSFTGISRNGRNFNGSLTYNVGAAVPEPATWAMMIGGFGAIGSTMRYRRRKLGISFG